MKKKELAQILAKFYLRYGRGFELTSFFLNAVKLIVYAGGLWYLTKAWFDIEFSKWFAIGFALIYIVICYIIGQLDEHYGFWKFQNSYASKELNPFNCILLAYLKEIDKDIKEINKKIDNEHKTFLI